MTHYSIKPKDRITNIGYGFLSFAKTKGKNIGKNISQTLTVNTARNFLAMLKSLLQMHLTLLQKE